MFILLLICCGGLKGLPTIKDSFIEQLNELGKRYFLIVIPFKPFSNFIYVKHSMIFNKLHECFDLGYGPFLSLLLRGWGFLKNSCNSSRSVMMPSWILYI